MSADDIQKGRFWTGELRRSLRTHRTGILCVTPENYKEPWLNFEAGAVSNSTERGKVLPLLLGLMPEDLKDSPLNLFFQITTAFDYSDVLRLLRSLNAECVAPIRDNILRERFENLWHGFHKEMEKISTQSVPGDSTTVRNVVSALAHHGINRSVSSQLIHFDSGFETHALYSTITEVATNRLLIFGRKNRKLFDKDHKAFFGNLKERVDRGFDFRIMFLDPRAPRDVLFRAHRDNNLPSQLRASIKQAEKTLKKFELDPPKHCRLYHIARTISFLVVDKVVLWSTLALDEKGRARPLTGAPFTLVNASSPLAQDMIGNFETFWKLAKKVTCP